VCIKVIQNAHILSCMLETTTFSPTSALPAEHINLLKHDVKSRYKRGTLIHISEMGSNLIFDLAFYQQLDEGFANTGIVLNTAETSTSGAIGEKRHHRCGMSGGGKSGGGDLPVLN
jgi:hypothetical protein